MSIFTLFENCIHISGGADTAKRSRLRCGSVMVDAAICFPIFIIAVAMLLHIINMAAKEENAYFSAVSRVQIVSAFGSGLELGITVDDPDRKVYIDHVQFYPLIADQKFPFPAFFGAPDLLAYMPYRSYIGESPDPYDDKPVYIFPKNEGSESKAPKYHSCACSAVKGSLSKNYTIETVSEPEAKERGYSLCAHCRKHDESN